MDRELLRSHRMQSMVLPWLFSVLALGLLSLVLLSPRAALADAGAPPTRTSTPAPTSTFTLAPTATLTLLPVGGGPVEIITSVPPPTIDVPTPTTAPRPAPGGALACLPIAIILILGVVIAATWFFTQRRGGEEYTT